MASKRLELRVRQITNEALGINTFELVASNGELLPPFSAGAHIDVHVPGGYLRQYSLCNDPRERHRYLIGVLEDRASSGGSVAMHHTVRAGDRLVVSEPRNNFPIVAEATRHLLLAGGIGVTPMMAMVEHLSAAGADFELHYCTRSAEQTAFCERLADRVDARRLHHYFDGGDRSRGLDMATLLEDHRPGTHLYYCGPAGFMQAVERAASHWPQGTTHFEYFQPPEEAPRADQDSTPGDGAFRVRLASNGAVYDVLAGQSIIEVLRDHGHEVESSCEAGICGTCKTRYLEGTPDHRDVVLTGSERKEWVMICCARSSSPMLVLDL